MTDLAISVVIPAFQAAATIAEAVASALDQTLPPADVIVVDDGSTDGTGDLVRQRFPGVIVIRQPNAGPAAASNTGLRHARGAAIAFHDADNLWPRERLEVLHRALAADDTAAGAGGRTESFVDPSLPPEVARRFVVDPPQNSMLATALLIRRSAFDEVGGYAEELRVGHTIDWAHRAQARGLKFATVPDIVIRRRLHPGTLSARSQGRDLHYLEVARRALNRRRTPGAG